MELSSSVKKSLKLVYRVSNNFLVFAGLFAGVGTGTARAQTFAEWFDQKNTQKKYLLQQIAALRTYAVYFKQGKNTAHNGLELISESLLAENSFHTTFYNKLKHISPSVKNSKQVTDIIIWQKNILVRLKSLDQDPLSTGEKNYATKVRSALLTDCDQQITQLQQLITGNTLQMNDQERLQHISVIHKAMQDNYQFASAFTAQIKVYGLQRTSELNNVISTKKFYGIQ